MNPLSLTLRLERDDSIPAFGGFLAAREDDGKCDVILLNVQRLMSPELLDASGAVVPVSREDRVRNLIQVMMHEFGHALENHFRLPVNEAAIERAAVAWESAFANT